MAEKTIKVDKAVHQRLEEIKQEYSVETFNEVLRRELDIVSSPDLDELAAFLHGNLQETVGGIDDVIRDIGDFEERVKESGRREVLEFVIAGTNKVVASITFDENSFQVKYRSQSGEMNDCGRGWYSTTGNKPSYGHVRDVHNQTDPEDVIKQVENKVSGAYRRWGN